MSSNFIFSIHFIWLLLVLTNFIIQIIYFFHDDSRNLLITKKVTTPLLLFFGLFIVIIQSGSFTLIPGLILLMMGIGEVGIEGSRIVENREDEKNNGEEVKEKTSIPIVLAGVLFLMVNLFLGAYLILQGTEMLPLLTVLLISILTIFIMLFIIIKGFKPAETTRNQMIIYSIGLIVLMTGTLLDINRGISSLGRAALLLTISDSLVLIRMGMDLNKKTRSGFRILMAFLLVILLLYYSYMGTLINIGSHFPI
ncbi:MAG: hypothetical protein JEY99_00820 [Spirochaetales bacterium]|nr:hypothetical protein [Spirochaetales bacterium]